MPIDPTVEISLVSLRRLVGRCNPFYPLSALCMFAGCFAIIHAADLGPGQLPRLIGLLAVINLYEALLIGLGLLLARTGRSPRDGRFLLVIEVLFLVDATFLVSECASVNRTWGLAVAIATGVLAVAKLVVVTRVLGLRWRPHVWLWTTVALAMVLLAPWALARLEVDGELDPRWAWAGWWAAGLLIAGGPRLAARSIGGRRQLYDQPLRIALAVAPAVSLLGHLYGSGWVYRAEFSAAFASPVLLGAAVWLPRMLPQSNPRFVGVGQLLLPIAAMLLSIDAPATPIAEWGVSISALRLALLSAGLTWLYAAWVHRSVMFAVLGSLTPLTGLIGPTPEIVANRLSRAAGWLWQLARDNAPRTIGQWGIAGIIAAFLFLAAGAWLSFRPRKASRRSLKP